MVRRLTSRRFTTVGLLITTVVIAILAAPTIVAFNWYTVTGKRVVG